MSLSKCCISGFSHGGEPVGKIERIGGTKTYVSLPPAGVEHDSSKALLFLPDVFGLELENAKLLADNYAKNGIAVYIPDYLNGDAIGKDELNSGTYDLMAWIGKHGKEATRPSLDALIAALRAQGITHFAANGFCFGGRSVMELVVEKMDGLKCVVLSHPSLLKVPDDLLKMKSASEETGVKMLFQFAETDIQMGPEQQKVSNDLFANFDNYKSILYNGVSHGFLVRGDLSNPEQKEAMETGFKNSVDFILANI